MKRSFIKGFTLAEVLITLTVIGVIAALTIPSLITSIQDAQYHTAWKKSFSDFDQATKRVIMDNGGTLKNAFTTENSLRDLFLQYLTYTKKCDSGQGKGNCWHTDNTWYSLNNQPIGPLWGNCSGIILNNGNLLRICKNSSDCSTPEGSINVCAYITVDINGWKAPNTVGRDIYYLWILENKVLPEGSVDDGITSDCASDRFGQSCAARYLYQ